MRILRPFWMILFAVMSVAAVMAQSSRTLGSENGASPSNLSPGVAAIIKLANAGVSDQVIITYIDTSRKSFDLTTDDIIALNNSKVSATVIDAVLRHDGLYNAQPPTATVVPAPIPLSDDASSTIIQQPLPPPPIVEVVPAAPEPWYIWRPGHWYYRSTGWRWWGGAWIAPRRVLTPPPVRVAPQPYAPPVPVPRPVPQPRSVIVAPR